MTQDFRDLDVWKRAHLLVLEIYRCSGKLSEEEQEGIVADIRRSAVAVPAGIARSSGFVEEDDVRECLLGAQYSLTEVDLELCVLRDLDRLPGADIDRIEKMAAEVRKALKKQISKLRVSSS